MLSPLTEAVEGDGFTVYEQVSRQLLLAPENKTGPVAAVDSVTSMVWERALFDAGHIEVLAAVSGHGEVAADLFVQSEVGSWRPVGWCDDRQILEIQDAVIAQLGTADPRAVDEAVLAIFAGPSNPVVDELVDPEVVERAVASLAPPAQGDDTPRDPVQVWNSMDPATRSLLDAPPEIDLERDYVVVTAPDSWVSDNHGLCTITEGLSH